MLWLFFPCMGDVVLLKNGGKLEGVIVSQNSQKITIDLGFGSMDVMRTEISSVARSSKTENLKIRKGWSSEYFDQLRFVPPGCEPVANSLRSLFALRRDAMVEAKQISTLSERVQQIQTELKEAKQTERNAAERLGSANAASSPAEYNQIVSEVNESRSRISLLQGELEDLENRQNAGSPALSAYATALGNFPRQLKAARKSVAASHNRPAPEIDTFFVRAKDICRELGSEFRGTEIKVPATANRHLVLPVAINGGKIARLLFDTGASEVTLSMWFATQIGLDLSGAELVTVAVADGRKAKARRVTLSSVSVGEAKARNVSAVVMDESPGPGLDGLLGMSFLGRFLIELDAPSGKLVLRSFEAR